MPMPLSNADTLLLAALAVAIALEAVAILRLTHDRRCARRIAKRIRSGWLQQRAVQLPDAYAVRAYGPIDVAASVFSEGGPAALKLGAAAGASGPSAAALRELARDASAGLSSSVALAGAAGDVASAALTGDGPEIRLRATAGWAHAVQATAPSSTPQDATALLVPASVGGAGAGSSWLLTFSPSGE